MPEIHTIHLLRGNLNVISDVQKGTITLQYTQDRDGVKAIDQILTAIGSRFGDRAISRLGSGEESPFKLPTRSRPHPDCADVLCFTIGLKPGQAIESALANLLNFLRQQPGYVRTLGAPLDPDEARARRTPTGSTPETARAILTEQFRRRTDPSKKRP